jgi:hypothetical protein
MMRLRGLLVVSVVGISSAFAGGESLANETRVHPTEPPPKIILNPGIVAALGAPPDVSACASLATADRVDHVIDGGIYLFSQGAIGHPGCAGFVADFTLDKASINPKASIQALTFDGRDNVRETFTGNHTYYVMHITKEQCSSYKHWIWAYRKKSGEKEFTPFGGGGMTPTFDTGGLDGKGLGGPICRLKPDAAFKPIESALPPTAAGVADVYRMVLVVPNPPGQLILSATHGNPT